MWARKLSQGFSQFRTFGVEEEVEVVVVEDDRRQDTSKESRHQMPLPLAATYLPRLVVSPCEELPGGCNCLVDDNETKKGGKREMSARGNGSCCCKKQKPASNP